MPVIIKITGRPGFEILAELVPSTSGSIVGVDSMALFMDKSISGKSSSVGVEFSVIVGREVGMAVGLGVEVGFGDGVGVLEGEEVGAFVGVGEGVIVGVGVGVGVGAKSVQRVVGFVGVWLDCHCPPSGILE